MRYTRTGRTEGPFLPATASNVGTARFTLSSQQSRAAARGLMVARGFAREKGISFKSSVIGKIFDPAKECTCRLPQKGVLHCAGA
jgi:hypothetical protein